MGLKQFVDEHPFKVIASIVVGVATTTAAVTGSLISKKAEIESSSAQLDAKIEIASLKTRLASIERRVGTDDQSYFDVSKLIVTPHGTKSLDKSYKTMAGGGFFIFEPALKDWYFSQTSELEMAKEGLNISDDRPLVQAFGEGIRKKNVYLWRTRETYILRSTDKDADKDDSLTLYPFVLVELLYEDDFRGALSAAGKMFSKSNEIDKLNEVTQASSDKDISSKELSLKEREADVAAETERILSQLFRGDMAAFMLQRLIDTNLNVTRLFPDTQFTLATVQKRANILYMESQIEFKNVSINGKEPSGRLILDQEFFIVTSPSGVSVVKVQVPSYDGRGEARAWADQWLTGLRLPLLK